MASFPGPPSTHARSRRSHASSSESSGTRVFGISNVKFRVGAPPLRPLPLVPKRLNKDVSSIHERFGDRLEMQAKRILNEHGVFKDDVADSDPDDICEADIVARHIPGQPWTSEVTMFITAPWTEESPITWQKAVKDIKIFCDDQLERAGMANMDICVEIIAPELMWRKYMSPILDQPHLESIWPEMQHQVENILESNVATASFMTSISLFRLGFSSNREYNPPTVYVSLDYESEEIGWPPVVNAIQTYLDATYPGLEFHMEHGMPESCAFPLLPTSHLSRDKIHDMAINEDYQQRVDLGAELGPGKYIIGNDQKERGAGLGTLGCYLEIKTKTNPHWTKYALTNYHFLRPCFDGFLLEAGPLKNGDGSSEIVAPRASSDLQSVDHSGYHPNSTRTPAALESPTRLRHNYSLLKHDDSIGGRERRLNAPNAVVTPPDVARLELEKRQRNAKATFFDLGNHHLGTLFAASGYGRRSSTKGRLDWALLSIDTARQGRNVLPDYEVWASKLLSGQCPSYTSNVLQAAPSGLSLRASKDGDAVYKMGAKTGATCGKYSVYKSNVRLKEEKHMPGDRQSSEYAFIGESSSDPFGIQGDSGAVVFNTHGHLVGLLFRGQLPTNSQDQLTYVTPIEDVFEDMKKFSRGAITDIRVAVP